MAPKLGGGQPLRNISERSCRDKKEATRPVAGSGAKVIRTRRRPVGDSAISMIPESARFDVHENIRDLGQLRSNMRAYIGGDFM